MGSTASVARVKHGKSDWGGVKEEEESEGSNSSCVALMWGGGTPSTVAMIFHYVIRSDCRSSGSASKRLINRVSLGNNRKLAVTQVGKRGCGKILLFLKICQNIGQTICYWLTLSFPTTTQ